MNIEIQSAEIKNCISHTFTFSKPIRQFIVGFSKFSMKFSKSDHHIKEISIDLTNSEIKGNQIIIQPLLKMRDSSDHKQSRQSTITVVVMASFGNNIHMYTTAKTGERIDLPKINVKPTFIKSALTYTFARYTKSDHHINSYLSEISPVVDSNFFILKGKSLIQDQNYHFGNGIVSGGVVIYYGKDQDVLCSDFDSSKIKQDQTGMINDEQTICFGEVPADFNCDNYEVGCFISSFRLSYEDTSDHHVKKIEISAMLSENKLVMKDGKSYTKVCLKSFLSDEEHHQYNIPHNNVSGFLLAYNKKAS